MNNQKLASVVFIVIGLLLGWALKGWYQVKQITTDHSSSSMESGMEHQMNEMVSGLSGKTGEAFDKAFLDEMIVHHEGAVEMAKQALLNAKHQEIKDMAGAIISAQTKEIDQMKKWKEVW